MSAGCSGGGTCSAAPVHVEIYGVTGYSVLHAALCSMDYVLKTRGFCLRIRWLLAAPAARESTVEHGFFQKCQGIGRTPGTHRSVHGGRQQKGAEHK